MIMLVIFIAVISVFEIRAVIKSKHKKEISVLIFLAIATIALGWLYTSDKTSIAGDILNLIGYKK